MIRPIQVPNTRHLRVQHTFSSVTFHELTIQQSFEGEFRQHDSVMTVMMMLPTQVDYGGGGHRTRLKDQLINLCVYGVPPPPYIKEWRRGRAGPLLWRALGSPTPTRSRIPPIPSSRSRREGRGREKRRKEGAPPPPLVQFGLGKGGTRHLWPALSLLH